MPRPTGRTWRRSSSRPASSAPRPPPSSGWARPSVTGSAGGGRLGPVLRHRPDRPGGRAGTGEAGTVLLTSATPAGAAPHWLRTLAGSAQRMTAPPLLQPPASGTGRPSAVLMLFGETEGEPGLLIVQRSPWLRRPAGQPAFPRGALAAAGHRPGRAAPRAGAAGAGG